MTTYLRLKLCQFGMEEVTESTEKRKPNRNRSFFVKYQPKPNRVYAQETVTTLVWLAVNMLLLPTCTLGVVTVNT